MSAPRTLSLSGLFVILACTLAACGSKSSDSNSSNASTATPVGTQPAATSALTANSPTAHDPAACSFLSVADVKKLVPGVTKSTGTPTSCTYTDAAGGTPSLGFLFLSKGLIQQGIASGPNKTWSVPKAWDEQLKAARKLTDFKAISGLGGKAYAQIDPGTITVRWFIKDHAYYLHFNFDPKSKKEKKLVSLKDLEKFAATVPDPSKVPHT